MNLQPSDSPSTPAPPLPRGVPAGTEMYAPGGHESGPAPKFATPRPADPKGEVPRVVNPLERVPPGSGLRRFKVRLDNPADIATRPPVRYVLARSEVEVRAFYLKSVGFEGEVSRLKASGVVNVPTPNLVVTTLAD